MIEYLRAQWEQRPFLVIVAVTAPIAFVITFLAILAANGGGERSVIRLFQEQQGSTQGEAVVLQQQEQQTPVYDVRTDRRPSSADQQSSETSSTRPAQPARTPESAESASEDAGPQSEPDTTSPAEEEQVAIEDLPALDDVLIEKIDRSSMKYGGNGEAGAILPIDNGVVPSSGPRFATTWELWVPSARIYATVNKVGRTPGGAMGAPDNPDVIGWLHSSAAPGEAGNSLMVGHRDYTDINGRVGYGVCWELDKSRLGDAIIVIDTDNALAYVYEIIEKVTIDPKDSDSLDYLRQTEEPVVTLITCNGSFDVNTHSYSHRLVLVGLLRHVTRA